MGEQFADVVRVGRREEQALGQLRDLDKIVDRRRHPVHRPQGRRAARGTVGRPAGPAPPLLLGQDDDDGRRAELLADARSRGNGGAVGRASAGRRACGAVGRPAGPAAPVVRLGGAVG